MSGIQSAYDKHTNKKQGLGNNKHKYDENFTPYLVSEGMSCHPDDIVASSSFANTIYNVHTSDDPCLPVRQLNIYYFRIHKKKLVVN